MFFGPIEFTIMKIVELKRESYFFLATPSISETISINLTKSPLQGCIGRLKTILKNKELRSTDFAQVVITSLVHNDQQSLGKELIKTANNQQKVFWGCKSEWNAHLCTYRC